MTTAGTAMLLALTSACSVFGGDHENRDLQPEQTIKILRVRLADLKKGMPVFNALKKHDGLTSTSCHDNPGESGGPAEVRDNYAMPYPVSKGKDLAAQFEQYLQSRGWHKAYRIDEGGATVSMVAPDGFGIILDVRGEHAYVDSVSPCVKSPGEAYLQKHS